jgi:hypothetical protein
VGRRRAQIIRAAVFCARYLINGGFEASYEAILFYDGAICIESAGERDEKDNVLLRAFGLDDSVGMVRRLHSKSTFGAVLTPIQGSIRFEHHLTLAHSNHMQGNLGQ